MHTRFSQKNAKFSFFLTFFIFFSHFPIISFFWLFMRYQTNENVIYEAYIKSLMFNDQVGCKYEVRSIILKEFQHFLSKKMSKMEIFHWILSIHFFQILWKFSALWPSLGDVLSDRASDWSDLAGKKQICIYSLNIRG